MTPRSSSCPVTPSRMAGSGLRGVFGVRREPLRSSPARGPPPRADPGRPEPPRSSPERGPPPRADPGRPEPPRGRSSCELAARRPASSRGRPRKAPDRWPCCLPSFARARSSSRLPGCSLMSPSLPAVCAPTNARPPATRPHPAVGAQGIAGDETNASSGGDSFNGVSSCVRRDLAAGVASVDRQLAGPSRSSPPIHDVHGGCRTPRSAPGAHEARASDTTRFTSRHAVKHSMATYTAAATARRTSRRNGSDHPSTSQALTPRTTAAITIPLTSGATTP